MWQRRADIDELMPAVFKEKYPSTQVIIDCTEIKFQAPKSLVLKSQLNSPYKSTNTVKGLIGIAPSGQITFICLYILEGCLMLKLLTRVTLH